MSPKGGGDPSGKLGDDIKKTFGDIASFKKQFSDAAATVFGSGWAWLVVEDKALKIMSTPNQDTPAMTKGQTPILGLDVWEHAYYLKYQNKRQAYIDAW